MSRARCKLHSEVQGNPKVSSILGTQDVFSLHVYVVNFPVELLRKCINRLRTGKTIPVT